MEPATSVRLRYLPQLDGLRALAVALVIIHHLLPPTTFGGWIGVDLFFVLSGYLITSLLVVEIRDTGTIHLRAFYLRRMLRLYPPLITAVAILLPLGLLYSHSAMAYLGSSAIALTYSANIITTVTGKAVGPWAQTWTLALEEQFYLVWPVVLLLLVRFKIKREAVVGGAGILAVASMVASAVMYRSGSVGNFNPLFHVGPLLVGCILALTSGWIRTASSMKVGLIGLTVTGTAVVLASFAGIAGYAELIAIGGSVMIVAHLTASRSYGIFVTRPMVSVGRVSYEMYLWHFPLIILIGAKVSDPFLLAIIVVPLTVAASYLSRHFVSRPLNGRFKPRLSSFEPRALLDEPETVS